MMVHPSLSRRMTADGPSLSGSFAPYVDRGRPLRSLQRGRGPLLGAKVDGEVAEARVMSEHPSTVLLVGADVEERERQAQALGGAGYEVVVCPGPTEPDYSCIGDREGYCPLLEHADFVVLDTCLAGDEMGVGVSADQLLELYVGGGRSVVVLGSGGWLADPLDDERVVHLEAHPSEEELVTAVGSLAPATGFVFRSDP